MCGRLFAAIVALAVMLCMAPHGNSLLRPLSIRPKSKLTYPRYHVSIVHNRISADPFNEPDAESEEEDFLPPVLLPSMTDDDMEEVIDVAEPEVVAPAKGRGRKKKPSQNEITAEAVSEITTDAAAGIISTQRVLQARPPVRSWEEKYEDDPLKADVPTRDFEKPPERFEIRYFVMSKKFSSLERREELWIPHLQWARRSALAVPSEKVKAAVLSEFTLLSSDRMSPTAQALILGANDSTAAKDLLFTEPMSRATKGDSSVWESGLKTSPWDLWRAEIIQSHDNLTNPLRNPYIFFGPFGSKVSVEDLEVQRDFLIAAGDRVSVLAHLFKDSDTGSVNNPVGIMLMINALTNADAKRFLDQDPLSISKKYSAGTNLAPVNEQDVNGLHHLMARKFGEKTQLDQIHYMDPEDLFLESSNIPEIEYHNILNAEFLAELQAANKSFRYSRLDLVEYLGADSDEEAAERLQAAKTRNSEMSKFQRVRLQSLVDPDAGPIPVSGDAETADESSSEE